VGRRKKSCENREQLRCCNWIRLPNWANPREFPGGEGGKKVIPAAAGTKPGARIFVRSTSFCSHVAVQRQTARRAAATAKLLRKKENESWTMRLLLRRSLTAETPEA
jgi:hypothetical protein